ncbi:MAG: hypothetical protein GF350_08775 [Chitinivibrionales bacterium]|nr:hypothetical protein [Chitinivibrionales bacterium]
MFNKNKRRSWYWRAFAALLFAGFVYWLARFFLHSASRELKNSENGKNRKAGARYREAMFV